MIAYDHFEIKNLHELLKPKDLEEFEQQQGIIFLLKGAELGNLTSQKLVNDSIEHGGYKEYGIPSDSNIKQL